MSVSESESMKSSGECDVRLEEMLAVAKKVEEVLEVSYRTGQEDRRGEAVPKQVNEDDSASVEQDGNAFDDCMTNVYGAVAYQCVVSSARLFGRLVGSSVALMHSVVLETTLKNVSDVVRDVAVRKVGIDRFSVNL